MAAGLLGVGISGLLAYQRSLQTVSHNISNSTTEGYSRQRVDLGTQIPLFQGGGYIGTGVTTTGVERFHDSFLVDQLHTSISAYNESDVFAQNAGLIDEMLADPQVGLMPAVEDFFGAIQDMANNPASTTERSLLLSRSETLVDRFQYINQRFDDIRGQVNQLVTDDVAEINSLAQSIASINEDIALASSASPNDLLDERDRLIGELSKHVAVTTVEQDNGAVNVFFGKGQVLVINFDARSISATSNQYDLSEIEVGLDTGGGSIQTITDQVNGGSLGGVLDFRSQILDDAQNSLGLLAIGMAESFNAQHSLGQDLDGNLGQDFFQVPSLRVFPGTGVASTATASLVNSDNLTGDEYTLLYNGANSYTLTNNTDDTTTAIATGGAYPFTTVEVEGFNLTLAAGATAGDTFLIQPTRNGANEIATLITDPREVAAATPIRTSKPLSNTGNAEISSGSVTSVADLPLPADVTLTYNAGANEFVVAGAVPAVANIPYVNGGTIAFNGVEFTISGTPADTDFYTISNNTSGVGDNRNALLLAGLQDAGTLLGGNSSYGDLYASVVADVGILTGQANINRESRETLLTQAQNARDTLSGVNLDEEAANLVKFQQAYQAAAQVINVSNEMFQTLLGAIRR